MAPAARRARGSGVLPSERSGRRAQDHADLGAGVRSAPAAGGGLLEPFPSRGAGRGPSERSCRRTGDRGSASPGRDRPPRAAGARAPCDDAGPRVIRLRSGRASADPNRDGCACETPGLPPRAAAGGRCGQAERRPAAPRRGIGRGDAGGLPAPRPRGWRGSARPPGDPRSSPPAGRGEEEEGEARPTSWLSSPRRSARGFSATWTLRACVTRP